MNPNDIFFVFAILTPMTEHSYGIIPFIKTNEGYKVFLIHQYGSGGDMLWTFPKGRPEEGEAPIQTALRECKEEADLEPIKVYEETPLHNSYSFVRKGDAVDKTSTYYVGIVEKEAFTVQPEEVKEAGWFTIVEARERITFPDYKQMLDEAVAIVT